MTFRRIAFAVTFCAVIARAESISVDLGGASAFAILAGSTVTNTGPSVIGGDIGVDPGSAITGFPPGIVTGGAIHASDALTLQAQTDLTAAYDFAAGEPCGTILTGTDLGGLNLNAGVYCFASSAQLTGALTLNGQGDTSSVFVFQMANSFTSAGSSSVIFANGAQGNNVFWQVGSSATLGTSTAFAGNILALSSITLDTGASISCGRALARNGAVTLDSNSISIGSGCGASSLSDAPEPGSFFMLALAGLLLMWARKPEMPIFGHRSRKT